MPAKPGTVRLTITAAPDTAIALRSTAKRLGVTVTVLVNAVAQVLDGGGPGAQEIETAALAAEKRWGGARPGAGRPPSGSARPTAPGA